MYKLHSPKLPSVSSLKVKCPSKRVILVAVLSAVVLCALIGSLAVYQQHKQAEHDQAVIAAAAKQRADAQAKLVAQHQQADFQAAVARGDQACAYVRQLAANKAVTRYVVVPATCK